MTARKSAPKAEASTPQDASAEGPTPEPATEPAPKAEQPLSGVHTVEISDAPRPAPPHPIKRYRIGQAAHLGTRVGGFVLTERGWVRDTPEQE